MGYKALHEVRRDYKRLQGVLKAVTEGYKGLQEVKRSYKG